jgi:hypothetical protein
MNFRSWSTVLPFGQWSSAILVTVTGTPGCRWVGAAASRLAGGFRLAVQRVL